MMTNADARSRMLWRGAVRQGRDLPMLQKQQPGYIGACLYHKATTGRDIESTPVKRWPRTMALPAPGTGYNQHVPPP